MLKYAKYANQYMLKNAQYAILLALFLALPWLFLQDPHWQIRVNTSLLVNTMACASSEGASYQREPGLPSAGPAAGGPPAVHGQPPPRPPWLASAGLPPDSTSPIA